MSQLLSALMNTLFAAGSVPLIFTIERFGRRNILIHSAVALTVCLVIFIAMIGLPNPTAATQWTAVGAIFVYNFVFGYGWIGVPWLYGPEVTKSDQFSAAKSLNSNVVVQMAPLKLRHAGGAAGAFGEWLFSFITVFAGGIALENVGWKIWIWMALSCFVSIFFVFFLCPEVSQLPSPSPTKGKTLGVPLSNHVIRLLENLLKRLTYCLPRKVSSRAFLPARLYPIATKTRRMATRLAIPNRHKMGYISLREVR